MKKNLRKKNIFYCLLLTSLTLFNVGFSQWIYKNDLMTSIDSQIGQINKYDDIFSNFKISKTFTLTPNGILENGVIVSKGEVKCSFDINLDSAIGTGFLNKSKMKICTKIKSNNGTFLNYFIDPVVNLSNTTISPIEYKGSYIQNVLTLTTKQTSGVLYLEVSYYVQGSLGSFYDSKISLSFSAEAIKE